MGGLQREGEHLPDPQRLHSLLSEWRAEDWKVSPRENPPSQGDGLTIDG